MVWEMLSENQINTVDHEPDSMPGERLRAARTQNKLSVERVAASLHLKPNLIKALETDDYGKFPAPIFVSGYIRNYAKLVNLDPEPLVAAYERSGAKAPPILSEMTSKMARKRRRLGVINNWVGYIIVLVAVILIMAWLFSEPASKSVEVAEEPEFQDEQVSTLTTAPSPDPGVSEQTDDSQEPVMQDDAEPVLQQDEQVVPVEKPLETAQDTLVLHFTSESWVEISDITGRRIFYNMGYPGQTKTLRGNAPFDILLGYSPGVTIEYNGKVYDHSPYARNNVARFRLND